MTRDQLLFRIYTGIILLIVLVAICAPLISSYDPYESQIQNSLLPPSAEHYFGTDKLGRDIFTRILYGARISITMTLIVVIISSGLGTLIGVISAYIGGKVDNAIMRLTDVFLAFPGIVLAIAIAGVLGRQCGSRRCYCGVDKVCSSGAQSDPQGKAAGLSICSDHERNTSDCDDSPAYPAEYHTDHHCDGSA